MWRGQTMGGGLINWMGCYMCINAQCVSLFSQFCQPSSVVWAMHKDQMWGFIRHHSCDETRKNSHLAGTAGEVRIPRSSSPIFLILPFFHRLFQSWQIKSSVYKGLCSSSEKKRNSKPTSYVTRLVWIGSETANDSARNKAQVVCRSQTNEKDTASKTYRMIVVIRQLH